MHPNFFQELLPGEEPGQITDTRAPRPPRVIIVEQQKLDRPNVVLTRAERVQTLHTLATLNAKVAQVEEGQRRAQLHDLDCHFGESVA